MSELPMPVLPSNPTAPADREPFAPGLPAADASPHGRAPRGFARRHAALFAMVLADACTKLVAFGLLPHEETVRLLPGLRLRLAINEWGVMGGVQGLGPVAARPAYTMLLAAGLLVLAASILRLASTRRSFGRRVALGAAVFLGVAFAAEAGSEVLPAVPFPADVVVTTIRVAALALALAFYAASRAAGARAAFTLLAAGAVANAASALYPPFSVVDFLVVPLAPLSFLMGRHGAGFDASTVGVVNLADLYLFAFPLALAAWPLAAAARRARRRPPAPSAPVAQPRPLAP